MVDECTAYCYGALDHGKGILLALIGKYLGEIPQEFFYVLLFAEDDIQT